MDSVSPSCFCRKSIGQKQRRQSVTGKLLLIFLENNIIFVLFLNVFFSPAFQFVTDGEKPGGPPRNVRITGLTSTSLEVTWDDPEVRLRHGIITRYNLGYREYK